MKHGLVNWLYIDLALVYKVWLWVQTLVNPN